MDDPTFDPRATDPVFETSRRRLLGGLAGGTLAGVLGWRETAADRKRQDKHDNKSQQRRRDQGDKRQDQGGDTRQRDGESTQGGVRLRSVQARASREVSPALKVLTRNLYLGATSSPSSMPRPVRRSWQRSAQPSPWCTPPTSRSEPRR